MPDIDPLQALADPTRRRLVERLRAGPLPVGQLAQGLGVSRPAVSQHLQVLAAAGLLTVSPLGTRRIYRLDPQGLARVQAWLDALCQDARQCGEQTDRSDNPAEESDNWHQNCDIPQGRPPEF